MKNFFQQLNPQLYLSRTHHNRSRHTIRHFIAAMRRHDPALIDHGKRTAVYSLVIGRAAGLAAKTLSDLSHAALLHDLGKLTLPNEVVNQKGISIIGHYLMTECSPQAGAEILRPWPELQHISKIIALHHERWDGSGAPFGMRGHLIPLEARILSLADTVDQLFSQQEDSLPSQIDTVIRILRTFSGTRFDPRLVETFVDSFVPWIESEEYFAISDWLQPCQSHAIPLTWSPEYTNEPSKNDEQERSLGKSPIDSHILDIFELTNAVSYDATTSSIEK